MLGSQFPQYHTVSVIKQTHGVDGGERAQVTNALVPASVWPQG